MSAATKHSVENKQLSTEFPLGEHTSPFFFFFWVIDYHDHEQLREERSHLGFMISEGESMMAEKLDVAAATVAERSHLIYTQEAESTGNGERLQLLQVHHQ